MVKLNYAGDYKNHYCYAPPKDIEQKLFDYLQNNKLTSYYEFKNFRSYFYFTPEFTKITTFNLNNYLHIRCIIFKKGSNALLLIFELPIFELNKILNDVNYEKNI